MVTSTGTGSPMRVPVTGWVRLLPLATFAVVLIVAVDFAVQPIWNDDAWAIWAAKAESIVAFGDPYEPLRLVERQRPQNHGVDDTKDGGGRADSERQRDDDADGEERRAPQHARGVAKVHAEHEVMLQDLGSRFGARRKPEFAYWEIGN